MCGHLGLWNEELNHILSEGLPVEYKINKMVWIEHQPQAESFFLQPIHIYTDASKAGDDVGYGWIATDGDYAIAEEYYSAREISVYYGELSAVKEALMWLHDSNLLDRKVVIWSDSKGVVQCLNGYKAGSVLALETMNLLKKLASQLPIQVAWVKGHSNCTGNEAADMLAHRGAEEAGLLSYSSPFVPIMPKQINKAIHVSATQTWQSRWDSTTDCKISHLFKPLVGREEIVKKLSLTELSKLSQIITRHGLFKRHLRHWNDIDDISCALCGEDQEYSWHLWEYCPSLEAERMSIRLTMKSGLSWEKALLKFFILPKIEELTAHNEALIGI